MVKTNVGFPKQVAQLGELGLMGVAIGEKDGGTGLDYLVSDDACLPLPFVMIGVVECGSPIKFSNFAWKTREQHLGWGDKKIMRETGKTFRQACGLRAQQIPTYAILARSWL